MSNTAHDTRQGAVDPRPGTIRHTAEVSRLLSRSSELGVKVSYARTLRVPLAETRAKLERCFAAKR